MNKPRPARVRFAPSPTGRFHIGGARTALYDYLLSQQTGGQFILRIEDTDRKRFVPGAEEEIMDSLRWLGLDWDEGPDVGGPFGPYRQSERADLYRQHAHELIERGWAYYCFCTPQRLSQVRQAMQKAKQPPRYDRLCRALAPTDAAARAGNGDSHVIRFKTPESGTTQGQDLLRGAISVENQALDDYILLKSNGLPVYHLAALVDDHLMEITHVLRGSEWLPTFPLHVLIYQAFEWPQPEWVHLSLFLNPSGKGKLSKRQAVGPSKGITAIFVQDLKELGYLPEAVNNWLALMGWAYDDRTEYFPIADLIEKFSLKGLNASPAAVNFSKLDHFNGQYIRNLSTDELARRLGPVFESSGIHADPSLLSAITPLLQERIRTLDEAVSMAGFFFRDQVSPEPDDLVGKKMTSQDSAHALERSIHVVTQSPSMEIEHLEAALRDLADELELTAGQLFGIMRVAITGQKVSPPLIESMVVIGKEKVLERLESARVLLERL